MALMEDARSRKLAPIYSALERWVDAVLLRRVVQSQRDGYLEVPPGACGLTMLL